MCVHRALSAHQAVLLCAQNTLTRRHTDVMDSSSGRSYITEQWHKVPLLRTRGLSHTSAKPSSIHPKHDHPSRKETKLIWQRNNLPNVCYPSNVTSNFKGGPPACENIWYWVGCLHHLMNDSARWHSTREISETMKSSSYILSQKPSSKPGPSKLRPAGLIRPANVYSVARLSWMISLSCFWLGFLSLQ